MPKSELGPEAAGQGAGRLFVHLAPMFYWFSQSVVRG